MIAFTIPETLMGSDAENLKKMLKQALNEFSATRADPPVYVDNRYPSDSTRADKIAQVGSYLRLASQVYGAIDGMAFQETRAERPCYTCGYNIPSECDGQKCRG